MAPGPQSGNSFFSHVKTFFLTPAILLVLLHAGVSAAEEDLEKVSAKKKAEEEQETLELPVLVN